MIRLSAAERVLRDALKRELKLLEAPANKQRRQQARAAARARSKAVGTRGLGQRQPREEEPAYLAFLRTQPCVAGPLLGDGCEGRTDPAHLRFTNPVVGRVNPGLTRKSHDRFCLSLCRKHHEAQHLYGAERQWWVVEVGVDPDQLAATQYETFKTGGRALAA